MDGTLVDSVPDLASALNHMLKSLDRDTFDVGTIRSWVGNGARTLVRRGLSGDSVAHDSVDPELFSTALNTFLDYYAQNLCVETLTYPNVLTTLQYLNEKGYRLAIITNKPYAFVGPLLDGLHLSDFFELWLGGDSLEKRKPDPLPLHYLCKRMGVTVDECVMVGDSKNDILAATAANMQSIGVTYGYNYDEPITVYKPDHVVEDLSEIRGLLRGSA